MRSSKWMSPNNPHFFFVARVGFTDGGEEGEGEDGEAGCLLDVGGIGEGVEGGEERLVA